jgi:hypothetical protein
MQTTPAAKATLLLTLAAGCAAAQPIEWTAIRLHPDDAANSQANASWGRLQGGTISKANLGQASIWSGGPEGRMDLTPAWARGSRLHGMDGEVQGGQVLIGRQTYHAAMWRGTPESAVDLHPSDLYRGSVVNAVAGEMQVGTLRHTPTGDNHAGLWYGTPESFVDLHPDSASQSRALATDGTLQGGWASLPGGGDREATLWSGSADSVVNLAPDGALRSQVNAMAPGVQVGQVSFQGQNPIAALWRGSADSLEYLTPPGSNGSLLFGTDGSHHVGSAFFGSFGNAGIWLSDDPGSYVNLHQFLPPEYFVSSANAVFRSGDTIYVVGSATRAPTEAWLWVGVIPAPGTVPVLGGALWWMGIRRRRW